MNETTTPDGHATVSAEQVCRTCGGDGRSVFANVDDEDVCHSCGGTGLAPTQPIIEPEDEGIATADVLAQIAADQRSAAGYRAVRREQHPKGGDAARPVCAGCDLPETNCACG